MEIHKYIYLKELAVFIINICVCCDIYDAKPAELVQADNSCTNPDQLISHMLSPAD